jgi:thiol-disulfide isomerase/thioredoxin
MIAPVVVLTVIGLNRLKIVADYKRITQQRGSFRVVIMVLVGLLALAGGIALRSLQPLTLNTVQGQPFSWQSEQWTVVNFFAEWCQPCLREIPELNGVYNDQQFRVLGVSFDELDNEALSGVVARQNIRFPVVISEAVRDLPVSMPIVLPTTYIISPAGEVTMTIRGEVTQQKLYKAIKQAQSELL